jgi:Domain of unknown function (DUF4407)
MCRTGGIAYPGRMSYSEHRPGRFGSDGRIDLAEPSDPSDGTGDLYLSDVRAASSDVDEFDDAEIFTTLTNERPTAGQVAPAPVGAEPAQVKEPRSPRAPRAPRERGPRLSGWRRLAVLGGADADVLAQVPTETSRFVQMFFVLAGTALISAISMFFALMTGVRVAVWIAVPLAIVWALIIFNLDRFLTSTMKSTHSVGKLIALALPRVLMAAVIGIVVAEPLVLQIFQNDIAREVNSTNVVNAQTDQDAVTSGPEKLALDAASERVAALEQQAATGVVAGTSSESATTAAAQASVDDLTAKLAAQQTVIDQARALYQCELTGGGEAAGCTGVAGEGASSTAANDQLTQAQASYDDLATKLRTAEADLAAAQSAGTASVSASEATNKQQAADQLPAARTQYESALAAYDARAETIAGGNAEAVGLLSQITGLESLSQREPVLGWAHWLIAGLFFMIELLPVLVKVLTSWGDPSLYEKADDLRRQVALDRVTSRSFRERADIVTGTAA